jgi:hypothetical protein
MVCDAHLFIPQIDANIIGATWQGEMALLFSMWCGIGGLSMARCPDVSEFDSD